MGQQISNMFGKQQDAESYNIVMMGPSDSGKTSMLYKLGRGKHSTTTVHMFFQVEHDEFGYSGPTDWAPEQLDTSAKEQQNQGMISSTLSAISSTVGSVTSSVTSRLTSSSNQIKNQRYRFHVASLSLGGRTSIRQLVQHTLHDADAIVFMINANEFTQEEWYRDEVDYLVERNLCQNFSTDARDAERLLALPVLFLANKADLPFATSVQTIIEKLDLYKKLGNRTWYIQQTSVITGDGLTEGLDWLCAAVHTKRHANSASMEQVLHQKAIVAEEAKKEEPQQPKMTEAKKQGSAVSQLLRWTRKTTN